MQTCRQCGAVLRPDLGWCGLCFTRVPEVEHTLQGAMRDRAAGAPVAPSEFSRWKASPTSFGPTGRTLLSIGLLIGLLVGEPMLRGLTFVWVGIDVPGPGFVLLYAAVAVPGAAYLLVSRIWKRVRVA
jgi:hypothetical protein